MSMIDIIDGGGSEIFRTKSYISGVPYDHIIDGSKKCRVVQSHVRYYLPEMGTKRTATLTNDFGLSFTSLWITTKGREASLIYTVT